MATIKFLKKGIKVNGVYQPVFYSFGETISYGKDVITIYGRDYNNLPAELYPKNDTDTQQDYFANDVAYITKSNPYYKEIMKVISK